MALMEIDDETWDGLENPHVLLRPSDFENEEQDIRLNAGTFERARDFLYNPLEETETDNQSGSYIAYTISSQDGTILSSNSLGYIYEEHVEWLFPGAYQEKAKKGEESDEKNDKRLRVSEQ